MYDVFILNVYRVLLSVTETTKNSPSISYITSYLFTCTMRVWLTNADYVFCYLIKKKKNFFSNRYLRVRNGDDKTLMFSVGPYCIYNNNDVY